MTETTTPTTAAEPAPTELYLPSALENDLGRLVEAAYPFESCGLMTGRVAGRRVEVEEVFHARNLDVRRARDRYVLDPEDHLAVDRAAREAGLDIVGFWHSHPDHPARPSVTDRDAAWEGYSYLIVSTSACGVEDIRSWRLAGDRFCEEKIRQAEEVTPS